MDPFIGEIRIFAGTFAPNGWALCDGQLMSLSQNVPLFSLLGTTYGGDGRTNFALPNLAGAAPMHFGQGAGLSQRYLGESGGERTVTLLASEMPVHTHQPIAVDRAGDSGSPVGTTWARAAFGRGAVQQYDAGPPSVSMNPQGVGVAGGGQPHNNMPPYLAVNFIIALQGIFPPRG